MPELQNLFPEIVFALAKIKSCKNYTGHTATAVPQLQGDWANFRLLGDCVQWRGFLYYKRSKIFGHGESNLFDNSDKKVCWATFWTIFFTNSSGHPAHLVRFRLKILLNRPYVCRCGLPLKLAT
jgi:hypothetical protein